MARITRNQYVSRTGQVIQSDSQHSDSSGSHYSRDPRSNPLYSDPTFVDQVINSPAYQSAYQVLSAESDKSWLQRLEMIPYSVDDANQTFFDKIGFSSNYEDKQDANYQYCMEQISALMAEYQSWRNSLPVTQVQQLADAGINSAITGANISGSSIPNVGVSSDPSRLQSTNVGEYVHNFVDRFLNLSSGVLDWIGKFNEISLNNSRFKYDQDSSFADFVSQLSKDGIVLPSDIRSFDDLINSDDRSWYDNASSRAKRLFNEFTEIRSMDAYGHTIVDRTLKGDYRTGNIYAGESSDGRLISRFGSVDGASINMDEYSKNIADLQYNLWLKELEYRSEYAKKKKEWHDDNGYTNSEDIELFESEIKAHDKMLKALEREKMSIYVDYLKKLKSESDDGNLSSRVQLMDALYDLSNTSMIVDFGDELWKQLF